MFVRLGSCLLVFAAASVSAQAAGLKAEIIEFGVYNTRASGKRLAPRTATGRTNLLNHVRLERKTAKVGAMPGRSFGIRYRLAGSAAPGAQVTYRTIHPPITNPKTGKAWTVDEWGPASARTGVVRYIGYTFEQTWEMAEGLWTIQVLHRGKVIGQKVFKVIIPLN